MEPRIQYATTADGVSIACTSVGEGIPLINLFNAPFTHVELDHRLPQFSRWIYEFADDFRVVRYDTRGSGLSDRNVQYNTEALLSDIDAVADRMGAETFVLSGVQEAALIVMTYAVQRPDRVSHVALWDAFPSGPEYLNMPQTRAFLGLIENDWDLFVNTIGNVMMGWGTEEANQFNAYIRACIDQQDLLRFIEWARNTDVTPLLPQMTQPTVVIQHKEAPLSSMDTARFLASRIPDARLLPLNGTWRDPGGDVELILSAMKEMTGTGAEQQSTSPQPASPAAGLVTILFTDIEGSTALTQRLGDRAARDIMREHERITREALRDHGGSEIKTLGDGFMTSFASASRALECAIAMQRAFAEHNESTGHDVRVRVGVNAGEPIAEEQDLFGTAVIVAQRVAAQAAGGEILVSNVVRELAAGKGFLFSDRGEVVLRGFEDPVRVFELGWRTIG